VANRDILERAKGNSHILSCGYYEFIGEKGAYTRKTDGYSYQLFADSSGAKKSLARWHPNLVLENLDAKTRTWLTTGRNRKYQKGTQRPERGDEAAKRLGLSVRSYQAMNFGSSFSTV